VIRTCAPVGTTGTICGINNGVETCGFVTACSSNDCNNEPYTGVNIYTGTNTGSGTAMVNRNYGLNCMVCDSGAFAGNYIQKSFGNNQPYLQNQPNCMNGNLDPTTYLKDCATVVTAPNNVVPMYCARVDYNNPTTGAMEVIRTCAPVGTTGTICGINNGVETCGFVTACSTNNCNNDPFTGVNPYISSDGSGTNTARSCKDVPDIEYGSHQYYPNTDGHWPADICRVQYKCDPGYQMIGYPDVLCYDGVWSGSPPECKLIQCPLLTVPENGSITMVGEAPSHAFHSIAEFSCNDGYEIADEDDYVLTCTVDGTWSSNVPSCVPISCSDD